MVLHESLADSVAVTVVGIILATGVVWLGSRLVEQSIEQLTRSYDVAPSIREAVVLPAASSSPELVTVVVAGIWGAFEIGLGAILGSAIFNVLVIPAFIGIASPGVIDSDRPAVYLEVLWYLVAILALTLSVVLTLIYQGPIHVDAALTVQVGPAVGLLLLLLYGVHYVLHRSGAAEQSEMLTDGGLPTAADHPGARGMIGGIVLIAGIVGLVWAVDALSTASTVSGFLMGATYLAAATSVPDLLVLLQSRGTGGDATGLTHVLGSNTFDLLVAIPTGLLVVTALPVAPPAIQVGALVPVVAILTLATILLFGVLRTDLELTTNESYVLLGAYMLFIVGAVAEMVGQLGILRGV